VCVLLLRSHRGTARAGQRQGPPRQDSYLSRLPGLRHSYLSRLPGLRPAVVAPATGSQQDVTGSRPGRRERERARERGRDPHPSRMPARAHLKRWTGARVRTRTARAFANASQALAGFLGASTRDEVTLCASEARPGPPAPRCPRRWSAAASGDGAAASGDGASPGRPSLNASHLGQRLQLLPVLLRHAPHFRRLHGPGGLVGEGQVVEAVVACAVEEVGVVDRGFVSRVPTNVAL
jgi:hypothetical protein